ncbi:MAG: DUF1643 domain-containing protein [Bacteroidota bacterium]
MKTSFQNPSHKLVFSSDSGAILSSNQKERFVLWRKWDDSKPTILFIGLNPSVADDVKTDPTTKRIVSHSKRWGFGRCFLMNCFAYISTNPKNLTPSGDWQQNLKWLDTIAPFCSEVIFAWGQHPLVKTLGRDNYFQKRFPNAKCMGTNLDGSPKHPLYLPYSSKPRYYHSV